MLPDAVHPYGAKIFAQISHMGRKSSGAPFDVNAASAEALEALPGLFAQAARRAREAGYDGVEIHMAHGYLLADVLDPDVNQRTDAFGGSDAHRFALIRNILQAVRDEVGDEFYVLVKFNVNCSSGNDYDATLTYYAEQLSLCQVDAIEVSGHRINKFSRTDSAYFLREARLVNAVSNLPVILTGGIHEVGVMQEVLQSGIDLLGMARPFICEPDFVKKLEQGATKSKCAHCWGCFKSYKTKYQPCIFAPVSASLKALYGQDEA